MRLIPSIGRRLWNMSGNATRVSGNASGKSKSASSPMHLRGPAPISIQATLGERKWLGRTQENSSPWPSLALECRASAFRGGMLTLDRPGTTQKTPAIALVKERDGTLSNGH